MTSKRSKQYIYNRIVLFFLLLSHFEDKLFHQIVLTSYIKDIEIRNYLKKNEKNIYKTDDPSIFFLTTT